VLKSKVGNPPEKVNRDQFADKKIRSTFDPQQA